MESTSLPQPVKDPAIVVQLAEQYKCAPFSMSPHAAYAAARHAVAVLLTGPAPSLSPPLVWKTYGTHGLYGTEGWAFAWFNNEEDNLTQFEVYEAPDGGHWRTFVHVGADARCIDTTATRELAMQVAQDHAEQLAKSAIAASSG
jgi:hypothetical protein